MDRPPTKFYPLPLRAALPFFQVQPADLVRDEQDPRTEALDLQRPARLPVDAPPEPVRRKDHEGHDEDGDCRRTGSWSLRRTDRKSTRLNSSHSQISYAVFCLK